MSELEEQLRGILRRSPSRMAALQSVRAMNLPHGAIGAGYVRAAVWDHLTGQSNTPVEDVDVLYLDPGDTSKDSERTIERHLQQRHPGLEWSVRNQVRMAERKGDARYVSLHDALRHWLETPTCVAVNLLVDGGIGIVAPFGLDDLFAMRVRPTPRGRERAADYRKRIAEKRWQDRWPGVTIEMI